MTRLAIVLALVAVASCVRTAEERAATTPAELDRASWPDVVARAAGTTVNFAMWSGDEARSRFFQTTVTQALATRLGITLRLVPTADPADVVNKLLTERRAGRADGGSIDIVWINGENFRTAKEGGVLWGPFAARLPNIARYEPSATRADFGTPIEGYEAPWEYAQFVFAYDSARVGAPPSTLAELKAWMAAHPGRFTYPAVPDFTGSAFIRHVLVHASGLPPDAFTRPFDETLYATASEAAIAWLRDIRPKLWRSGETYPANPPELQRLFANGEVDFAMNYGPTFAADLVARGLFPPTVRTFVLREGTLANFSFLAIPFNAANPAGALATINYLLSADYAIARMQAMGGVLPFAPETLTGDERRLMDALPAPGAAALPLSVLRAHRIMEPDAEYLTRFERDWRREVLLR